ncbi:MAG: C_GCAxxG_C_C family protein [Oscillospiraceae bacterium]|nr:C_GCAxxG_C_C family protein [Oscillospiraceae bacterium]
MGAKEKALALHDQGFNCAQSVVAALGEYTGLDEKTALAVSGGFGGGVRCGEICGACSGAVMALGLAHPHTSGEDTEARAMIGRLAGAFTRQFAADQGCLRCVDLKRAGRPCDDLIAYAAEAAETILKNT